MASYDKTIVAKSYFIDEKLDPHRQNAIQTVKELLIEKGSFHIDDFHKRISESKGVPITSNYTSLLTVMVENNYLKKDKKTKIYSATTLLKAFLGLYNENNNN